MKKFTVVTVDCLKDEKKVWEDMGFVLTGDKILYDKSQCPDVIFCHWPSQDNTVWEPVRKALPKVLVITGDRGIAFPGYLSRIYDKQVINGKDLSFTLGSRIRGQVTVPDWKAYAVNGVLTVAGQIKALAGSVYRFLLEDIIRENEEWCGHMSSVVGPM